MKKDLNEVIHVRKMSTPTKIAIETEAMNAVKIDIEMKTMIVKGTAGMH